MSDNKTIDNVHVHIYGHEMLGEVISRARKNNIPYDKDMYYDFHSHGHVYLVHQQGQFTLVEDPIPNHSKEGSLNDLFELYFSKEEEKDKFAELKEAYWNGAEIQFYDEKRKCWFDCGIPCWNPKFKYRIKLEEKPKVGDVVKAWVDDENDYFIGVLDYINVNGDYVVKFQNYHDRSIYTFKARFAKTLTRQEAIELLFPNK